MRYTLIMKRCPPSISKLLLYVLINNRHGVVGCSELERNLRIPRRFFGLIFVFLLFLPCRRQDLLTWAGRGLVRVTPRFPIV